MKLGLSTLGEINWPVYQGIQRYNVRKQHSSVVFSGIMFSSESLIIQDRLHLPLARGIKIDTRRLLEPIAISVQPALLVFTPKTCAFVHWLFDL